MNQIRTVARNAASLETAFQPRQPTFDSILRDWAASGPDEEYESRRKAMTILNNLHREESNTSIALMQPSTVCLAKFNLTSLPPVFHLLISVTILKLEGNKLSTLPDLPPHVNHLDVSANRLISLPQLPEKLNVLGVDFNRLTTLPDLPPSLNYLAAMGNRLVMLPPIPPGMLEIYCGNNRLEHLPELPDSMTMLSVSHNKLKKLQPLKGRFIMFDVRHNQIEELPDGIVEATSGGILDVAHNPLSRSTLARLANVSPTTIVNTAASVRFNSVPPIDQPINTYRPSSRMQLSGGFFLRHTVGGSVNKWIRNAPLSELGARQTAGARIVYAHKHKLGMLNLHELGLTSLPSCIHKLTSLQILSVYGNSLYMLPQLPPTLAALEVSRNKLSELPMLPAGIRSIQADQNQLRHLPILPDTIEELLVAQNCLTEISRFPSQLQDLRLTGNYFRQLPPLPPKLRQLSAGYNFIEELPDLPPTLDSMHAPYNQLKRLPPLPESMFELIVSGNQLVELPNTLFGPNVRVGMFLAVDNPLPEKEWARLRALPESIVTEIAQPAAATDLIDVGAASSLPYAHVMEDEHTMNNALQKWHPSVSNNRAHAAKWHAIAHEDYALTFAGLLDRLVETAEYQSPAYKPVLKARVAGLLEAMVDDPALRKLCFVISESASTTCGDRVTLALNDMELARIDCEAEHGTRSIDDLYATGLEKYRLSEVEKIADEKIAALHRNNLAPDAIEVRLGFHIRLMDSLQLPLVSETMLFTHSTGISPAELTSAVERVQKRSNGEGPIIFMANWQPWQKAVERECMQNESAEKFLKLAQDKEKRREALDPKPEHMSEQEWMAALKKNEQIEVQERVDLIARLTKNYVRRNRT